MHTHWNGLLDDHSEPVAQHHSERLSGSPYAQGLSMAGLKAIAEAFRLVGGNELEELARRAEWLFRFQLDGFKRLYDGIGFIRDMQRLAPSDSDKEPCLSDYSMPCPSLVLLDPEVLVHDLDHLYERTLDELVTDMGTPGNPWMFGKYHDGGGSYSHGGVTGSLLNLCRLEEAGGYLSELLKYGEDTRLRYVLSEGILCEDEWYRAHHAEMKRRAPWVYRDLDEKDPSLAGGARNPGCLVQLTYWLYCADLICGISAEGPGVKVWPKIPGYMGFFAVTDYSTRHGAVSYRYQREAGRDTRDAGDARADRITLSLSKPPVEATVILGPLPAVHEATVGGTPVGFEEIRVGDGAFARIGIPRGEESLVVEVSQL